jgi:hypothetical protein
MPSVIAHLLDGEELTHTSQGYEARVSYQVENVFGNESSRLYTAMQADGVPPIGEPHPTVPNISVVDRQAKCYPNSPNTVRVDVVYRTPEPGEKLAGEGEGVVSLSTTVQTAETQFDAYFDPIRVTYTGESIDEDGNLVTTTTTQTATVSIQEPSTVLRITRRESTPRFEEAIAYVGKVNSRFWSRGLPRQWLCTGITADTDDDGATYIVTYEFQHNPSLSGWDITVAWQDENGNIPEDATDGNGLKRNVQVYPERDFAQLGVGFS